MAMSNCRSLSSLSIILVLLMVIVGVAKADIESDKAECTNQLVGLSTCLSFANGNAKLPTPGCCQGLKVVVEKSIKCLCVLVKDHNDPSLNLHINATKTMSLPQLCNVPEADVKRCPAVLHLAPNSPEAKLFNQLIAAQSNSTAAHATGSSSSTTATPANSRSNCGRSFGGGSGTWWLMVELVGYGSVIALLLLS